MKHILFRYKQLGGHVHVDVFTGTEDEAANEARGRNGHLVFREDEWLAFQSILGDRVTLAKYDIREGRSGQFEGRVEGRTP